MNNSRMIIENSLSIAWAKALKATIADNSAPLCVSVLRGGDDFANEHPGLREEIDLVLSKENFASPRETSETIFPYFHWSRTKLNVRDLTEWYIRRFLPRYKILARKRKRATQETYFERLVAYSGFYNNKKKMVDRSINQLENIIEAIRHYRQEGTSPTPSRLMATCFNPSTDSFKKDGTTNMSRFFPFPCLQQVGFAYKNDQLTVSGYYTIQYLIKRGYGNYLGLCKLGEFVAYETGIPLARVNCFVGNPRITLPQSKFPRVLECIDSLLS